MKIFKNINFNKLKDGLSKTRNRLVNSLNETLTGKKIIDDATIDEIEEILITADLGYDTSEKIIEKVKSTLKAESDHSNINVINIVKDELVKSISDVNLQNEVPDDLKPFVILIVGVNGAGKTTTIGKLANNFKLGGSSVIVGAADTFRAAANEQLEIWAERAGVKVLQKNKGADPSAVAFDTVKTAVDNGFDVAIIDTAGRLHSKANLMNELDKIKRSVSKVLPGAPHETLLVLDGTVGQNAIMQAREFSKVTDISGLVITKLDGTAKGGAVFQICISENIPIKYIGVGEKIDDLQLFDPKLFVDAIFQSELAE